MKHVARGRSQPGGDHQTQSDPGTTDHHHLYYFRYFLTEQILFPGDCRRAADEAVRIHPEVSEGVQQLR